MALVPSCSQAWSKHHPQLYRFSKFQPGWCMRQAYSMIANMWPTRCLKTLSPASYFCEPPPRYSRRSHMTGRRPYKARTRNGFARPNQMVMYTYASWKTRMHCRLLCLKFCGCPKVERQHEHEHVCVCVRVYLGVASVRKQ